MLGVVAVHTLAYTAPPTSRAAGALLMLLHVNREVFFFITALVLTYSTGAAARGFDVRRFWRRRFPAILAPYLAWTVVYWLLTGGAPWSSAPSLDSLGQLGADLAVGWYHLYFLLVSMQLYVLFPLLGLLLRRTRGRHGALLVASAALQVGLTGAMQYAWGGLPQAVRGGLGYAQVEFTSYQFYFVAGAVVAAHLEEVLAWLRRRRRRVALGAVALIAAGELVYAAHLAGGQTPAGAAGVFQPAVLLLVLAVLALLTLLADGLLAEQPVEGPARRLVRGAADISFGVFLAHMVPLLALTQTGLGAAIGLDRLPWPVASGATYVAVVAVTGALVVLLRRTALSLPLTGRTRVRRRLPAPGPAASPAGAGPAAG